MNTTELTQREKFESWARSQKLGLAFGDCGYVFSSTEMAWRSWLASSAELVEALESAQRTIAELEARTVTVKLPEVRITVSESRRRNLNWRELGAYNEGAEVAVEKMVRALAAAGIKCEVKGE